MVRLITHNILTCAAKGCIDSGKNYPLSFNNVQGIEIREQEFNDEFIKSFFHKLDYKVLKSTLQSLGDDTLKVNEIDDINSQSEEFLRSLHRVLLEMDVTQGELVCPNCQHKYPINEGIPNMLLAAHEI
ncbi:Trm112p-domain-containing protein [Wallemia mellicola]|uniref:Trm112p-domain-containing protein n=1 Tax=Wallemia mellicola TaxID=1708541 RepID=A0A4T0P4N9_9BASI|nr:hypothetical protein E3Q23_03798 [Wallemia mellicola]TIB81644.1 Trm112p-domain-containing protein [Wallemia mellicola]TIB95177.1 Trm112p-domain-containing protein [Wallemia mellicola]TIC04209.1 Trm112p-domain-containing protein [Wallemia mellicola]TIC07604.1 Trm112p-domain-containing protein [Wallemia mellicola]